MNASVCALVPIWHTVQQWGKSIGAKITRIDLAHDDFLGETVNIEKAKAWYYEGGFTSNGRPPAAKFIDDMGSGKGKTLYIGKRQNGKMLRIYEKGRQLGDSSSPWVRVELELRGKNRLIPWDAVNSPATYLAGGYLLWSLVEASKQLGNVSVRTVRRLVARGDLPSVRVGRLVRIPSAAVHNWIAQNSITTHNQNCVEPEAWKGIKPCYTNAQTRNIGGSVLPMQAAKELGVLLALPIEKKRKR